MADKTFKMVVEVDASGAIKGMKMVNAETDEFIAKQGAVEKSRKKATKGAKDYVTQQKGVGELTNNSTHAFAKMAQQMNGIVPVYATVAANVFAITAAFGALERAADFKILIDSADTLAVQTGRSLTSLAENMKDITGSAISMKEALVQASIAASAGFDNSTIEQLTQVARNASVALGREMTDSLNRVFKGAIKAEPELLDELGIILRLETAANKYAVTLGKTAKELTTFEKQQAVVNEVLAQGEQKFGRLSEVDPNPFTQLSAAFSEITTTLVNLLNTPIAGFISFFTENIASLTAAIILLATSVAKQALPALASMGTAAVTSFTRVASAAKKAEETVNKFVDAANKRATAGNVARALNSELELVKKTASEGAISKIFDGTVEPVKRVQTALNSINGTLTALKVKAKTTKLSIADTETLSRLTQYKDKLVLLRNEIKDTGIRTDLLASSTTRLGSVVKSVTGTIAIAASTMAGLALSMSNAASNVTAAVGPFATIQTIWEGLRGSANKTDNIFIKLGKTAGAAIGGIGAGLLKLVPVIGIATIAWQVLSSVYTGIKNAFGFEDIAKLTEKLEEQHEALIKSADAAANFHNNIKDLPNTLTNVNEKLTLQSNILAGIAGNLKKVNDAIDTDNGFGWLDTLLDFFNAGQLDQFKEDIPLIIEQIDKLGFGAAVSDNIRDMADAFVLGGKEAEYLGKTLQDTVENLQRISMGAKEANQSIVDGVDTLNKSSGKLFGSLPALSGVDKVLSNITDLSNRLDGSEFETVADTLNGMSALTLSTLGLEDVIEELRNVEDAAFRSNIIIGNLRANLSQLGGDAFRPGGEAIAILAAIKEIEVSIEVQKNQLFDNLVDPLDEARLRFETLSNAARVLKDGLSNLKLDKLNIQNTPKDTLRLVDQETKLRLESISIQTDAAEKASKSLDTEATKLEAKRLASVDVIKAARAAKDEIGEKKAIGDLGVIASLQSVNFENQKKYQAELDKTRGKGIDILLKQNKSLTKEVKTIVELQAKGVVGLEARFASANEHLKNNVGLLAQLGNKTEAWSNTVIASQEELARSAKFNADSGLGTIEALAAQGMVLKNNTKDMNQQLALNEQLNGLLFTRADTQQLISANAMQIQEQALQGQLELLNAQRTDPGLSDEKRASADAAHTAELTRLAQLKTLQDELAANTIANLAQQAAQTVANMQLELGFLAQKAKQGSLFNKLDKEALAIAKLKSKLKGNDPKDIKKIISLQKQLNKETRKFDFAKELQKSAEAMNELADGMSNLFEALQDDQFDNFVAGLMLIQDIGDNIEGPLGNMAEGFATAALASEQYADQLKSISDRTFEARDANDGELTALQEKNFELEKQQANYQLIGNAAGALAGAFEEGSSAAKVFALAQQGVAIASAAAAIAQQGSGDPYSAFARIAAMIALMASVLGAAGIAFSGGGSGSNSIENDYSNRLGSDALLDRDLQGNYLIDAIDQLVNIDTQLFSATRDLQITMKNLVDIFEKVGAVVFGTISGQTLDTGSLNTGEIFEQNQESLIKVMSEIDKVVGDIIGGPILGDFMKSVTGDVLSSVFGGSSTESNAIDTGIDFATLIRVTEEGLTGGFAQLAQLTQVLVKTEKSGFLGIGGSSSSYLQEIPKGLDLDLGIALQDALNLTLDVVNGLVTTFASSVGGIDIAALFGNIDAKIFGDEFISLFELNAKDAGDAIGLYFSALSSDLLGEVLPFLKDYAIAGEELGATMVRITANTIDLTNSLNKVGANLNDIIGNLDIQPKLFTVEEVQTSGSIYAASLQAQIDAEKRKMSEVSGGFVSGLRERLAIFANILWYEARRLEQLQLSTLAGATVKADQLNAPIAAAAAALKLEIAAAWEKELLSQFKDIDEFSELFSMFSKAIFSESELLNISIGNATTNIEAGFAELINQVEGFSATDLAAISEEAGGDLGDTLRIFYDEALDTGLFNADVINGSEIDTAGAAAFATVVKLGASINQLDELMQNTADTIETLNNEYAQQILLFGKLEKEAALLSLAFDFEAALVEAKETGTNIALVEQAFALERLAIIKESFDQINDEITSSMDGIVEAVLEISKSSDLFDEIAFSTIKINKLVQQLSKGTSRVNLDSLVGDTAGLEDFIDNFQDIIDSLSTEGPGSISEEIDLVDELNQAILDRYNLELGLLQEQEQAYKDLSVEIQGYLNDIILSDASPLTNFERLGEAESQFLANAANIFSSDEEIAATAAADLLSSADTYLEAASGFFAIGPEYAKVFDQVTSVLGGIDTELLTKTDETVLAIEMLNDTTIEQLSVLDSILIELQSQNQATLETDIVTNITEGMLPLIGTITDKLQSIDDGTWTDIVNLLTMIGFSSTPITESVVTPTDTFTADILMGDIIATPTTGFAVGTPFVPEDMIANIHYGEVIVPESMAQGLRDGTLTLGDVQDNRDVVEAIKELTGVLAVSQEDIVDATNRNVNASIDIANSMANQRPAVRTAGVL